MFLNNIFLDLLAFEFSKNGTLRHHTYILSRDRTHALLLREHTQSDLFWVWSLDLQTGCVQGTRSEAGKIRKIGRDQTFRCCGPA